MVRLGQNRSDASAGETGGGSAASEFQSSEGIRMIRRKTGSLMQDGIRDILPDAACKPMEFELCGNKTKPCRT
jgi:hypothetical protein